MDIYINCMIIIWVVSEEGIRDINGYYIFFFLNNYWVLNYVLDIEEYFIYWYFDNIKYWFMILFRLFLEGWFIENRI